MQGVKLLNWSSKMNLANVEQIQREVEGTQNISESEETEYMTASGGNS